MYTILKEAVSVYTNEKDNYADLVTLTKFFADLGSDWGPLGDRWVIYHPKRLTG